MNKEKCKKEEHKTIGEASRAILVGMGVQWGALM